jgi:hypothetical protein
MRRHLLLSVAALWLTGTAPAAAFVNCAANPLQPACCPAPCPVFDAVKLAQNAGIGAAEMEEFGRWTAQLQTFSTIAQTIGSTAAPNLSLRGLSATSALRASIPAFASDVSQQLLASVDSARLDRAVPFQKLQAANFPVLPAVASVFSKATAPSAPPSLDTLDPWRRRTVAKTGLIAQLTDASTAVAGTTAAQLLGRALTKVNNVPTPDAPSYSPIAAAHHTPFKTPFNLIGVFQGAISLNNAGALAAQILSSLPILQQPIDIYNQVVTAQVGNVTDLIQSLTTVFENPEATAATALGLARQLDTTRYIDNFTAGTSAAQAAAKIVQQFNAQPEAFGRLLQPLSLSSDGQSPPDFSALAPIIESWLGNTKYGEFMQPIANGALRAQISAGAVVGQIAQHYPVALEGDAIATYARQAAALIDAQAPGTDTSILNGIAARPGQSFLKVR